MVKYNLVDLNIHVRTFGVNWGEIWKKSPINSFFDKYMSVTRKKANSCCQNPMASPLVHTSIPLRARKIYATPTPQGVASCSWVACCGSTTEHLSIFLSPSSLAAVCLINHSGFTLWGEKCFNVDFERNLSSRRFQWCIIQSILRVMKYNPGCHTKRKTKRFY